MSNETTAIVDDARQEVCELGEHTCFYHAGEPCIPSDLCECATSMTLCSLAEGGCCELPLDARNCDSCIADADTEDEEEYYPEDDGQPTQYEELQDVFGGDDSYYPNVDDDDLGDYDWGE